MDTWLLSLLFFVSPALAVKTDPKEDFYHAAVVEYCPHEGVDGEDTVMKNGVEYVKLIEKAAETADIVVFPEDALLSAFEDYTVFMEMPFGKNEPAPADNPKLHPVFRMFSKAARDNQIYVSICALEKDSSSGEELHFNTNVVFDRNGIVISRYRKFNLYGEDVNSTKVPDIAIFETDFGVRFGVFICADIFYKEPALTLVYQKNVTDFIYPNWFFSELKLGLSVQIQFGWAYLTDSNLLSAGVNSLEQGSTGSGIFAGRNGAVVNILNERNETRLLTAKLFKKGRIGKSEGKILEPLTEGVDSTHEIEPEDFQNYVTHLLTPHVKNKSLNRADSSKHELHLNEILEKTICQESLCCEFHINATFTFKPHEYLNMSDISYIKNDSYYHYQYRLGTFDGIKSFPNKTSAGIQVCAVIPCLNDSLASCWQKTGNTEPLEVRTESHGDIFLYSTVFNNIYIKSYTKETPDYTFPNILVSSKSSSPKAFGSAPDVKKMDFRYNGSSSKLSFSSDKLIYAGLYSRIISRDGGEPGIISNKKTA